MRLFAVIFALALGLVDFAAAQPQSFVYQGRLLDSLGVPITTPTVVRFGIYSGGTSMTPGMDSLLYQETTTVTPDATGIFSYRVGQAPDATFDLAPDIFQENAPPFFLQINIPFDGNALLPRTQLDSVPFALVSSQLTRADEAVNVPVMGARPLYGATTALSDDIGDVAGIILPPVENLVAGDATIPATWNGSSPTLEIAAALHNASLDPDPNQRTALLSFRLRGIESGASITFEATHAFSSAGVEVFEIPVAAQTGTLQPGELATWTYSRRSTQPADTLPGDVMLLRAQVMMNVAR